MRQAKRLFSKHKDSLPKPTSVFQSKIDRNLPNESVENLLGPGEYEVSSPIVRPKFEAIRKSNNTVIIKINEKNSPAFQSLQPRFKSQRYQHNPHQKHETFAFMSNQGKNDRLIKNQSKTDFVNKSIKISNRMKKFEEVLNLNLRMHGNRNHDSYRSDPIEESEAKKEILNSLKLFKKERERLHFIIKNSNMHQKIPRGTQWSRYRGTKGNLYSISNVPGPGTYHDTAYSKKQSYLETIGNDKSWQFKSITKRSDLSLHLNEEELDSMTTKSPRFVSDLEGKFYKVDSIRIINQSTEKL